MAEQIRILLLNVNTSQALTERMATVAMAAARPGTEVIATQPRWGVSSVEGYFDGYLSVAACLDRLQELAVDGRWDAIIWAGFGDHGREGAQEISDVPVVSIAEAAAHAAMLLGHRFGIVTTLARSCPQIEDVLGAAGLLGRCAGIWPTGLGVLDAPDEASLVDGCVAAGQTAVAAGAEVICLGSGAMAGLADTVSDRLGVPVVDGVTAAVALAEALRRLRLSPSKINAYATPRPKERPGWPPVAGPPLGGPEN